MRTFRTVAVVGSAVVRQPLQWLGTLASLLFIAYVADALASALRTPDREFRRKALVICGSILAFITLAILESQLVVWKLLQMPIVIAPLFLILIGAITYEISRAIVASVRMEREAARLRDQLAHVSRVTMLGQLSGALAHELKQPLTAILADAQAAQVLLKAGKTNLPELLEILADICAASVRADAIIERARALMKRSDSELQATSLGAVASDVLSLVKADAVKRGITLELSLPESIPQVRADRVQLSQVLLNLVLNGAHVEVAVVDSGTGIPDDVFPRLFQAFVTTKHEGMGLGLVLSRSIVQAHGGDLRAENNAGRGATFRFTLATSS